nr:kynureninase-like isoform X2 [Hydra vulgaris]
MSANDYLLPQEYFRKMSQESGFLIETQQFAEYLQNIDELKYIRQEFHYPKNKTLHGVDLNIINGEDECIYLCGNSLGLCPKSLRSIIDEEITKWQECGVQGHHYGKRPWEHIDAFVIDQTASLVGAKPIEVVSMDSLTTNLHLLMVPFYRPTLSRHKILFEEGCFPSDRALIESQICFHGYDPKTSMLQAAPREGEYLLRTEDILQLIHEQGDSIALILFSGVQYKTGQYFDLQAITEAGHHKGCKVGFDLAHAVGNVELKLHDWNVDFAAWCTYKYLNAGPGSIGGLFIHERYAYEKDLKRFSGWWGVEFKERFHMDNRYLEYLIKYKFGSDINSSSNNSGIFISIITPENLTSRGSQLSLAFSCNGTEIFAELKRRGVVCDFRQPNVMRVAPAPLYNSFVDVHKFISILTEVVTLLKK